MLQTLIISECQLRLKGNLLAAATCLTMHHDTDTVTCQAHP
jgi:hypothetical protein